ncbi:hypothetical protein ID866_8558 [Astraeus odoratus]|nr:hypothetical protein ID866_8558 [Astraeus odoratus]
MILTTMTMTTHHQAALEAITSSQWTPQAINKFQSFLAHCNPAPPLYMPTQQAAAVQCKLNFQDHLHVFCLDHSKVTFTQSYLKGMEPEWFKPDLLSSSNLEDCPLWMDNWREFIIELQFMFGPHNLVTDAENQLNHLQMKDGQHINKYIVEFNRLVSQFHGYGDGALHHYFYSGLPDCVKDEICWDIDTHFWECKEEIQWANKSSPSTPNSASLSKPNNSNDKKSINASSSNPKLANQLSKDSKLMAAE